jgi:hypothetical protein
MSKERLSEIFGRLVHNALGNNFFHFAKTCLRSRNIAGQASRAFCRLIFSQRTPECSKAHKAAPFSHLLSPKKALLSLPFRLRHGLFFTPK